MSNIKYMLLKLWGNVHYVLLALLVVVVAFLAIGYNHASRKADLQYPAVEVNQPSPEVEVYAPGDFYKINKESIFTEIVYLKDRTDSCNPTSTAGSFWAMLTNRDMSKPVENAPYMFCAAFNVATKTARSEGAKALVDGQWLDEYSDYGRDLYATFSKDAEFTQDSVWTKYVNQCVQSSYSTDVIVKLENRFGIYLNKQEIIDMANQLCLGSVAGSWNATDRMASQAVPPWR